MNRALKTVLRTILLFALAAAAFGARAQSLSASPSSIYASQSETATWSGISAPTSTDWIGLYPVGAADNAFVDFQYTDGSAAGSAPFLIPGTAASGTYELRLFSNNGYTKLATSNSFTVQTPPPANLSASPSSLYASQSSTATWSSIFAPTSTDWIGLYVVGSADNAFVDFQYTDGSAAGNAPFLIPGTAAAGTYELRLFTNNSYTKLATSNSFTVQTPPPANLSVAQSSIFASQSVTTSWSSIFAPTSTDWLGLYPVGAADNAFVAFQYTDGNASGTAPFLVPGTTAAGTYEIRLFTNNGYTKLATSNSFTVQTPPPATLSVTPGSVPPGGTATAAWTSIFAPTATDWIGLYAPNAADNAFVAFVYTNGAAAGNVPFNIPANLAPGTYQMRLFSNNGYTKLATSNNFSVSTAKLSFIQVDHLNTPRLVADAAQATIWKWDNQEPFGNDSPNGDPGNTGTTFDLPLRLPGQYYDIETQILYNNQRDCFNPATGRYCQSDPLGLVGGLNTYSYAANNVLSIADYFGLVLPSQEPPKDPRTISGPYDAPPRTVDKILDRIADFIVKQLTGLGGLVTGKPIAFGIPLLLHSGRLNENEDEELRRIRRQNTMCVPEKSGSTK